MGRIFLTMCICTLITIYGTSQCPDLPNNVEVNGTNDLDFPLCGAQSVTFTVDDPNLPNGTIDWYSSNTSGFDPLISGTLIGSSAISSSVTPLCPAIESIYIDACDDEGGNEFMIVSSGSGVAVNDLTFTFDVANTGGSAANGNINFGGVCGWTTGNLALVFGCTTMISVGPGDFVPPNSTMIIQTSSGGITSYDVSGICGTSDCIYVLRSSCERIIGGFSNSDAGTGASNVRINILGIAGCPDDVLIYDLLDPTFDATDGAHVYKDLTFANFGCNVGPSISTIPQATLSASTDPFNHIFNCDDELFVVGVLNSTEYNEDCCGEQITNEYSFNVACPEAELSGGGVICTGECTDINVTFSGGVSPYDLNLEVTGSLFPIPFSLTNFDVGETITICYDSLGPPLDPGTNTVNVPALFGDFNGFVELLSFQDDNGCAGIVTGLPVNIDFNDAPDIITPPPFTECDMGDGTAFFILSDYDIIINDGTGLTVNYFSDAMGTIPISNPYQSSGTTTIYAQVEDNPCSSEIVPVILEVIANGDAGIVSMFCNIGGTNSLECTICDNDNVPGEEVTITIVFQEVTVVYNFDVLVSPMGGAPFTISGVSNAGTGTITLDIFETTTFQVTLVDPDNDCPDMTDLGDAVTIIYGMTPDMDDPGDLSNCGDIVLPAITGNSIPANAGYYTMPGGMGTMSMPGDLISASTTLYLYGGFTGCDQEIEIELTIVTAGTIDDPGTINACGSYILPAITGTNVDNANYYTETNAGGMILPVGQNITASTTIFIFDPICTGAEVSFMVIITPGSVITTGPDTLVCDTFFVEAIEGMDLTGLESYYELTGGTGQEISVGDTITQDTTIYIYDNTPGCVQEIPFVISIAQPLFPGLDSSIVICESDPVLYNINQLLAGSAPDPSGFWIESGTNIINDSTQVDFSSLTVGPYSFDYMINDTICQESSATLSVSIVGAVDAGIDTLYAVCENITGVNVYELLGNPVEGGVFVDNGGTPATFDPSNATFTTDIPGLLVYSYIVGDPQSSCGADTSIFSIITGAEINAGDDASRTICVGETLLVSTLLTNNTALGIYSEPVTSGALDIIGNFNSVGLTDGDEYIIYHILAGSGTCPDDTATITITLVDGPSAGDEQDYEVCGDDLVVNLEDILDPDADSNGSFYLGSVEITDPMIDFTGISGDLEYLYIVGNGIGCPFDTAILSISIPLTPVFALSFDNASICPEDCATLTITAGANNAQQMTAFYNISDNNGFIENRTAIIEMLSSPHTLELCEGDGSQMNNFLMPGNTYTVTLDSLYLDGSDCIYFPGAISSIEVLNISTFLLEDTYCVGEEPMLGADTYTAIMPNGVTTIPSANGCDSIITVDFEFLESVEGEYTESFCDGASIEVLGTIYTSDYIGDSLLVGASAGGCDSLVKIDISFSDVIIEDYPLIRCEGEIDTIAGVIFNDTNSTAQVPIPGGSANGCDSILNVSITYLTESDGIFDPMVCGTFSVDIGTETFDITNPSGMVILEGQNMNGCDSVLMIDLDFSGSGVDSMFALSTCDEDYSIDIGTETFDFSNQSGSAISAGVNGECDTIFTVNLTFGQTNIEFENINAGCEVVDSGSVIITLDNGELPYNITYNGNNTIGFVIPIEIPLPVGAGELQITDNSGCQTTISYEILEGNEEEDFNIVANGNQLSIVGGIIDSVLWAPNDSISCIDCINPIVNPQSTTIYTATVYYGGSCMVDLEYVFNVIDELPDYILPSGFSPNRDGTNDNFFLTVTNGAIGIPLRMEIYDRWGNRVFVTTGEDITQTGWDGTWNNNEVTSGVYVYRVQIQELDKTISLYGDVTVVR